MSKITKLGLGIVSFEGNEHIKNITYELRDLCDVIVVCLQDKSYQGTPIDPDDVAEVMNLKEHGFIDDVIWFTSARKLTNDKESPRLIELDKRNFILDYLEKTCTCSHSMVIDSDEFYDKNDFAAAKKAISDSKDIHVTYCRYVNYYRDYCHTIVWSIDTYVPFITESSYRFSFYEGAFKGAADLTRRYKIDGKDGNTTYAILNYQTVKMHHLSWIRINIEKKVDSWSAQKYFDYKTLRMRVLDRYYNFKDGQNAIIMINTPENSLVISKLPKQYIHPRFRLDEKITKDIDEYRSLDNGNKQ